MSGTRHKLRRRESPPTLLTSSCLCAGAINSAVSPPQPPPTKTTLAASPTTPTRSACNFMYHQADAILALSTQSNSDAYTKTWGTNDFYFRDSDPAYPFPLGQVQPIGSFHHEMMKSDAPPLTPGFVLETMKQHAVPGGSRRKTSPIPTTACNPRKHNTRLCDYSFSIPCRPAPRRRHRPHPGRQSKHHRLHRPTWPHPHQLHP